ncbi:choice-of-anchor D domain-containing protein [Algibacter sp. AS12]|uniref:choice-of-anchor D domain-containing protein n=1 Tax=Algibacter sp. AS12 TaxID=3135773 RepID=UPI00398A78DA
MNKKLLLLTLILTIGVNVIQSQNNKVFYIDEDPREIRMMDVGGGNDQVFFKQTENLAPKYVTVNNTTQELYFVGSSGGYEIFKIGMDGLGEESIYSGSSTIYELEIDEANGKIYWGEYESLKMANLDGSNVQTIKSVTGGTFRGVAVGGSYLYWSEAIYSNPTNSTTIYRGALDGTGPITIHSEAYTYPAVPSVLASLYGLDVDVTNNEIYWADNSANGVFKKNSDGSGGVTTIYSNADFSPRALALDVPNNKVYWADTVSAADAIQMCNLDGTGFTTLASGLDDPRGVDVAMVTPTSVGVPEIDIQGNGLSILNNDMSPSETDNTDFGNVALNNNYKEHYFFVRNFGSTALTLSSDPKVTISGAHASDFTLQMDAMVSIGGVGASYFVIRFDPTVLGTRTATVTVNSNDSDEGVYAFSIQGEGSVSSGETGDNDVRITTHATGGGLDNEDPSIAYDPTLDRFLVVFEKEMINSDEEIFGQFINNSGALIGGEFRISKTGVDGNTALDAADPKIVFNPVTNQYMVVWRADQIDTDTEMYGHIINPDGTLVSGFGNEIKLTQNGPDGDGTYYLSTPTIEVNTTNGEYFAVWQANVTSSTSDYNIYGQRLSTAGALVGSKIQLSQSATATQYASSPSVSYNPINNGYLVAYYADFPVNGDNNIWSRLVSSTGALGTLTQVTNVAASRDADFASVIYNPLNNEFLITFQGDIGPTDNEDEIYGQIMTAAGVLSGTAFQVSFAGVDGDGEETGSYSSLAYNSTENHILITFQSEEPGSAAYDIFAATLDASNYAVLETQSRVSDMGDVNGNSSYTAQKPKQAYDSTNNAFFIVWEGDDNTPGDGEDEVFGQKWQSPPTAEIDIQGNGVSIADGDTTPETNDDTDFGTVGVGGSIVKSFTIFSTNTEQLVLNGTPTISISGADASNYSVTEAPDTAISPGNSTTFEITFTSGVVGVSNASISIENNDVGEGVYTFDIKAEISGTLDTSENRLNSLTQMYPNPNTGLFTLKYSGSESLNQLQVIDVLGKRLETISLKDFSGSQEVDLTKLSTGMYLIAISSESSIITKRMVIK